MNFKYTEAEKTAYKPSCTSNPESTVTDPWPRRPTGHHRPRRFWAKLDTVWRQHRQDFLTDGVSGTWQEGSGRRTPGLLCPEQKAGSPPDGERKRLWVEQASGEDEGLTGDQTSNEMLHRVQEKSLIPRPEAATPAEACVQSCGLRWHPELGSGRVPNIPWIEKGGSLFLGSLNRQYGLCWAPTSRQGVWNFRCTPGRGRLRDQLQIKLQALRLWGASLVESTERVLGQLTAGGIMCLTLLRQDSWKFVHGFLWTSSHAPLRPADFALCPSLAVNHSWGRSYRRSPVSPSRESLSLEMVLKTSNAQLF